MNELALHPQVYATGPSRGLVPMLEDIWIKNLVPGDGTLYVLSGFANYNGGVRFYQTFKNHINRGGQVIIILGGSTSQRLSSKQVVEELLNCGVEVHIVNRKRLLHAKCYGAVTSLGESLIVSSGNFTGPGMSQNVELSLKLDTDSTRSLGYQWNQMLSDILRQNWEFYRPSLSDRDDPSWQLLYDEVATPLALDETEAVTLVMILSHSDTARINAAPGSPASLGTQYFWLSKDCFGFFPPLTIPNRRGEKATYSVEVEMLFADLQQSETVRVTFEAENNLDFRLGTGVLRNTGLASEGDLVAITRTAEKKYELRLFRKTTPEFERLSRYAVTFIGHAGKRYGFIPNDTFDRVVAA